MDLFFGHLNDTSTSNRFTRFVLANKPFSTADFDKLHLELAKDPTAAGLLLTSETNRALFLSDFSGRVQRIITWLERFREAKVISQATFNKDIIHNFASHLVIPLLDSPYSEFFPICGFPDLVVSTIHLSYVYRSRSAGPKTHRILLERISKFPDLIRRILPSIDGAKVIQTVLEEAQSGAESRSFGTQTLAEWTNVAANLCQGCHADHFVKDELSRWSSLVGLLNALRKALKADSSRHSQGATSGSPPGVPLSLEDLRALALFNLQRPAGIGAVEVTIAQLQERKTFLLFQAFVKSFPCAACLRLNTVTANPSLKTRPNSLSFSALPNSFTSTLLGQKLGPWKVCLSERAFKDMLMSNKDGHLNAIASKLRELASGHWDPKSLRKPLSQKMLEEAQVKERVPLWRASYGSNGRILWQINVAFDEDYGTDCQIITVWRIGDSSEIRRSIRDILLLQKTYTTSDIHLRHVSLLEFPVLPEKYWGSVKQKSNGADLDETVLEAQKTLMSNKIYCITEKVLDRIFMAPESAHVEFPFDVSHEETEIIKQANRAAFILGRSGTGKTTCLLYKLLCRNIASRENGTTVRQIFLTRSTYLAQKLQDYLERLMAFQLGTFPTAKKTDERKVMQNDLREAKDPLEHLTLENIDDNKFPIVCTFDHLFNFLEKIIRLNDRKDFSALIGRRWEEVTIMRRVARMINYNVYRDQYWKKYVYDREKGFEPDLVFSEILGIIKGSTSSKRKFQPLSREEYLELSARRAPVFTDARSTVYDIYQSYERKKGSLGDRDDIDRVTYLLGSLEEDQNLKRSVQSLFDEVYVDEVQDNKLLEIDLLLTLVRNPRGIHFAGDTAQCISRDNTFRFQDVQTRFHEHFSAMANKARKDSWAKPELYKLAKNYRSHQGILSLAADIVQLLYNGFPSQIDILPREVGTYTGTKPTMFVGFDYTILKQPGTGTLETEASSVCFGADQVIIVRDDAAKQKLKKELKSPLILTIFESKGLEFDDVILYNFFSDSVWKSMGTSVLSLLLDKQAARYLDKKYAGLCTELKHLYVAATRARNNLWMVESDPESVQNIVKLWTRVEELKEPLISVVENSPTGEQEAKDIIKPSRGTELRAWKERGEALLHQGLYEDALLIFRRAQHQQGQNLANAYLLYEEASGLDVDESNNLSPQAIELFLRAAQLFDDAFFIQKAAETYAAVGDYIKAAQVLQADEEYGKAGIWYERAGEFVKAATCYHMANEYDNAVTAYRRGERFAELIAYWNQHRCCISKGVKKQYSPLIKMLRQCGDLWDAPFSQEAEEIIDAIIAHALTPIPQTIILETRGLDLLKGILQLGQLFKGTHELAIAALTRSGQESKVTSAFKKEVQDLIGRLAKRSRHVEKTKARFTQPEARDLLEMDSEQLREKIFVDLQTLGRFIREAEAWKTQILDGIAEGEGEGERSF